MAGTRLGPYEILAPLGAGGMGEVWKARDTRLDRLVAVKILPPAFSDRAESLARFEREAKAVAALSHPGILGIFDFGKAEGLSYAAMELLEGQTLRERLRSGPLPPKKVRDFGLQIAEALAAAHGKGIVHRDLKPENLWITTAGRIKILDYGLAKQVESVPDGDQTGIPTQTRPGGTEPGTILGTVGYMSPEQVGGDPSDARSDLFSLGIVLYEMLSGKLPFRGETAVQTMNAILEREAPELVAPMGTLPPALERIVAHCLEKGPGARFQSAGDLAFALAGLSGDQEAAEREPRAAALRAGTSPARAWWVGGVLALTGAVAGWFLRPVPLPRVPAFTHLTSQQREIQEARITPDGTTVAYSALSPDGELGLNTTSRDGEVTRDLGIRKARLCTVSAKGELAVLLVPSVKASRGTLALVPLGGGTPKEIAEDVTDADWSPDGSELAAAIAPGLNVTTRDSSSRLEFPLGRRIYETGNLIEHPRVSPDGRAVAFMEHSEQGGDLTVVDGQGGRKVVVGHIQGETGHLCWSPDGREIFFTELLEHDRTMKLRAVDLKGRIRDLYRDLSASRRMDVDRSGVVLLRRQITRRRILARAPGETAERNLSWPEAGPRINLSKDGRQLAFVTTKENLGFRSQVHVRDLDGSPPKLLGEGAQPTFDWGGKDVRSITTDFPSKPILMPTGIGQLRGLANPGP